MVISSTSYFLQFTHPFGVSSNTRRETQSIFVKLEMNGFAGYGEACLPAYLGETAEATLAFFEKAKPVLEKINTDFVLQDVIRTIDALAEGNNAAKAALDIALHDLLGKIHSRTIAGLYGFEPAAPVSTSFTIGIDKEETVIKKIQEAKEFSILKIKAGTDNDKSLIELIRKHTDKPLYVDVNQGWKDKYFVLDMISWMYERNVVLVEQPMPVHMKEEMAWVTERSAIPTVADESIKRLKDLKDMKDVFSGVNIKLMKCTGIAEALEMIEYCKKNKLVVLLGCMAESSCATSAMAQLMGFADFIDLDAPQLYKNDPFTGITYKEGKVCLNTLPGTSALPIATLIDL